MFGVRNMPEIVFLVRWPDASVTQNYSPSSVVSDFFAAGETYQLANFLARARMALQKASDRVQEKYGFRCSRASATLAAIERKAEDFVKQPSAEVTILELG